MKVSPTAPKRKVRPHLRGRLWNALAAKVAGPVFVVSGLAAALGLWASGSPSWSVAVSVGLFSGVAAYMGTLHMVSRRLELARETLKQIRKHQFDNLDAADIGKGDELNDLIRQVYRTGQVLESEFEELNNLENYRREFVGNVSHELKTPIFAIRGFAETLLDGALEDAEVNQSFVEKIVRNADRLSNLARDLSEISKLETGQQQLAAEPFDLRRLSADVVESVESIAARKSISLTVRIAPDLPPVMGDPARIRQVFVNLVDNAIKYTNDGGIIQVEASLRDDGDVAIAVKDNGIGIAPEDLPRLTERFFRVDKSRSRSAGGTGLGLSIVKHILAAHNQVLRVESRIGHGSQFGFRLPAAAPYDLEDA